MPAPTGSADRSPSVISKLTYNEEQRQHNEATVSVPGYMTSSRFWFESFQNWQSEFLATGCIVLLTVWLRQRGSPESKPVDMAHDEMQPH